ncbi:MAG: hypothetical protein P1V36_09860, partial [Planctomycetota bacterium]|nr:hypothetical protein [Planctomycetota bacterium]
MRMHLPTALGLAALLVATTACSSGGSQPAQVQNYGPAAGAASSTTGGVARAPSRAPAYAPSTAPVGGPITWHTRLADAQAQARASGKLILVTSTKPRCSLCKKFKDQVAPAAGAELTRMAVGYIYDITRPEVRDVDRLLRANLRGADLMPLVGFITADLQWVHGFWGQRSVQQFRGDIARATSIHPVRTAALDPRAAPYQGDLRVQPATAAAAPRLGMVVNEYGEKEWGSAADIWPEGDPEPIDAITGAPAGLPTTVPAASGPGSPGVMLADATTTPTADPAPRPE